MDISERPIAMTDLETTGDVFSDHEILEIGLVVFDPKTFKVIDSLNVKVKPERLENAIPAAMARNNYRAEDWHDAVSLTEAMTIYNQKTQGAIFSSYNVSFDWGFMNEAFRKTKIKNGMDYHRIDVFSIAWERGIKNQKSWSLKTACEIFGIPGEPEPHSALNGAMTAYLLFKKLQQ